MDQKQEQALRQNAGLVLMYGIFCVIALGIYAWSVHRSQKIMENSLARLDQLARERAEAPVPVPRSKRATPKTNGSATMDE